MSIMPPWLRHCKLRSRPIRPSSV